MRPTSSCICFAQCFMKLDVMLETAQYTALFDSSNGAVCYRLYHKPTDSEILRTPASEEQLEKNRFLFGTPILFPPNRIRGGKFSFCGQDYTFPINEPETGSHLHGALYRLSFALEKQEKNAVVFSFQAKAGEYLNFPHGFRVKRIYTLTDNMGLQERTEIYNESDRVMPVMLAYHTTFNIPFSSGGQEEAHRLCLPVHLEHKRDSKYLPTCEYADTPVCKMLRSGAFIPCQNAISAFYAASGNTMRLVDEGKHCAVEYDTEGFGYWMLYNGGARDFLTVEPQTCAIDAFHIDKHYRDAGVIALSPGDKSVFQTAIRIINA